MLTINVYEIPKFLLETFLIITGVDILMIGLPTIKLNKELKKDAFLITKPNHSENQGHVECSGFSSAYVYRHLGKPVKGMDLYKEMPCKAPKGRVYCRGIVRLAKRYGFHAKFHIGNLTALKNTVAKGVPVIAMVRTRERSRALHFIAVVGYDEANIYAVDSVAGSRNAKNEHYNRVIPINTFKKLWNTSLFFQPLYFNLFFDFSENATKGGNHEERC